MSLATEFRLRRPTGVVPYSPDIIAMEEVKGAKTEVTYENAGQVPPNTERPSGKKAFGIAIQVWIVMIAGLAFTYWLWKNHLTKESKEVAA